MGARFYLNAVTVPPGTTAGAPIAVVWPLENGQLEFIDIRVPDGHAGFTGIRFKWSTAVIIPTVGDLFIVANGEVVHIPWDAEIAENALKVEAYNTDVFSHTFYLRAAVSDLAAPAPVSVVTGAAGGADVATVTGDVADLAEVGPVPPPEGAQAQEPVLSVAEGDLAGVIT